MNVIIGKHKSFLVALEASEMCETLGSMTFEFTLCGNKADMKTRLHPNRWSNTRKPKEYI